MPKSTYQQQLEWPSNLELFHVAQGPCPRSLVHISDDVISEGRGFGTQHWKRPSLAHLHCLQNTHYTLGRAIVYITVSLTRLDWKSMCVLVALQGCGRRGRPFELAIINMGWKMKHFLNFKPTASLNQLNTWSHDSDPIVCQHFVGSRKSGSHFVALSVRLRRMAAGKKGYPHHSLGGMLWTKDINSRNEQ